MTYLVSVHFRCHFHRCRRRRCWFRLPSFASSSLVCPSSSSAWSLSFRTFPSAVCSLVMPAVHASSDGTRWNQTASTLYLCPTTAAGCTSRCQWSTTILSSRSSRHYAEDDAILSNADTLDTPSSPYGCNPRYTHNKICVNTASHSMGACKHQCKLDITMPHL